MKNKYLIIDNRPQSWSNLMQKDNAYLITPYNNLTKPLKVLREVNRRLNKLFNIPYLTVWFNKTLRQDISSFTHIIVFVQKNSQDILTFLSEKINKNQRLIAWYWNPVFRVLNPKNTRNLKCEYWSFDIEDCLKFDMLHNSTFFLYPSSAFNVTNEYVYDYIYLGANKGRLNILNSLETKLDKLSLKSLFYIVDETKPKTQRKMLIPYDDYLDLIYTSRGIIDIVQDSQEGLTLRVMESIFFNKKLITNNRVIKELPFYNSNNIFILNQNSTLEDLKDFCNRPYIKVDPLFIDYYTFGEWLKRFDQ